jgi:hypothetical protein
MAESLLIPILKRNKAGEPRIRVLSHAGGNPASETAWNRTMKEKTE